MTNKDIFKLWAPINAKWTDWVRPVAFIELNHLTEINFHHKFEIPNINYIDELASNTAYIIDLPSYDGIMEGLGFARLGYRPIPLYNGTNPQSNAMALVDNKGIQDALVWGALQLEKMEINENALPVFLVDSNRLLRFKMNSSVYDNSWDLYDQDLPSYEYFLKNGIDRIVVRGEALQRDLKRILYKFQKNGISILLTNGYEKTKKIHIRKPPRKDKFH